MYEIVYISDKDDTGLKFCNIPDIFKLLSAPLPHSYIIPSIDHMSEIIDKLKIECLIFLLIPFRSKNDLERILEDCLR